MDTRRGVHAGVTLRGLVLSGVPLLAVFLGTGSGASQYGSPRASDAVSRTSAFGWIIRCNIFSVPLDIFQLPNHFPRIYPGILSKATELSEEISQFVASSPLMQPSSQTAHLQCAQMVCARRESQRRLRQETKCPLCECRVRGLSLVQEIDTGNGLKLVDTEEKTKLTNLGSAICKV